MQTKHSLLFFFFILALMIISPQYVYSQSAGGQITRETCSTCGKMKQNCPYNGNHPKCNTCGKFKEQCPYKGNHPKCDTCGKFKEQCPYNGNHPKCSTCGKLKEQCSYNGNHPKCNTCGKLKEQCPYNGNHPTTGTLSITSTPSSAVVKIDGKYMGETPLTLEKQNVGTYNVTFSTEGYETTEKSVTVTAGKTATCSATLKKKQIPQPVQQPTTTTATSPSSQTITANDISFKMIRVEGGTFMMGATSEQGSSDPYDDEKPAHRVMLSSYYIGETEVTQALWEAVMEENPSMFRSTNRPVEQVSWNDCKKFIKRLNRLTGKNFRLPTEAEWEFAARGGNKSLGYKYSGSDTLEHVAKYGDSHWGMTSPVKTKSPNELGIYDMSGNVYEWCQDWYGKEYYSSSPQSNPQGPSSGSDRVVRGGCWYYDSRRCRVSYRFGDRPNSRINYLGLRLAL